MTRVAKRKKGKADDSTTAKIKIGVYNQLVKLKKEFETISDVISRLLKIKEDFDAHKNCTLPKEEEK